MESQSNIERVVMRRVYRIHRLRMLISGGTLSMVAIATALYCIGKEVWVARVLENAPKELTHVPQFYFAAFQNTEFLVQVLTLLAFVSVVYLAREMARLLTSTLAVVEA